MATSAAERRVLLFSAGVKMALRLPMVREVLPLEPGEEEVRARGQVVPAVPLALSLGLAARPGRFAVLTEASPPVALRVDDVHGIADLSSGEVFQLPSRTLLPQPAPFQAALVLGEEIWLELALTAAGWVPLEPAPEWGPPPAAAPAADRELVFARGERRFAVPLALLSRVVEHPRVFPVPLAPSAHRGLLYHGRALHPVFDVAAVYGAEPGLGAGLALLVEAGGAPLAVLADRIASESAPGEALRPAWDAIFPP